MTSALMERADRLKAQVAGFYAVVWNAHDLGAIPALLHEDFSFRGSLGTETRGYVGFSDYVDTVNRALDEYRCVICDLVAEGDKVFARMVFTGIHRGQLMGIAPSGLCVSWAGCVLFTFSGDRIADLWVLGDLKSLEQELLRTSASTN